MKVRWLVPLAIAQSLLLAIALSPASAAEVESGYDRPGNDYNRFEMEPSIGGFAPCQSSCEADNKCKAWTFVKAGIQGSKAVCYHKSPAPKRVKNKCCVSGKPIRTGGGGGGDGGGGGGGGGTTISAEMQAMLNAHNSYRGRHGTPKMSWSSSLAQGAQDWANACVKKHSSFSNGYGENLFWGTNQTAKNAAGWWYDEIRNYDFNDPIGSYVAGDSDRNREVRHFTQLVWRSSTQLGCGVANCGGEQFFVCRYQPQGNFNGTNPGVLDSEVPRPN